MLCVYEKWRLWQDWVGCMRRLFNAFVVWQCNKYENLMSHRCPFCFCSLYLTLCMQGNFSFFFCRLLTFQNLLFRKILSGTLSEGQIVWIQIRTKMLLVLIWFHTTCKGYQQTTKVATSKESINKVLSLLQVEKGAFSPSRKEYRQLWLVVNMRRTRRCHVRFAGKCLRVTRTWPSINVSILATSLSNVESAAGGSRRRVISTLIK